MKKLFKKSFFIVFILFSLNSLHAEVPYIVDFKYILNQSSAGKKAQEFLQNKLNSGLKNLKEKEKKLQEEEKKIISQKKVITPEEYKKKVSELRNKVSSLQKERNNLLKNVADQRSKARNELLKNLNPILKNYMKEKKIRIIIDNKAILVADENLNITNDIMQILNQKKKSIKKK